MISERKEEIRKILASESRVCSICDYDVHYRSGYPSGSLYDHDYVRSTGIEDELLKALDEAEDAIRWNEKDEGQEELEDAARGL